MAARPPGLVREDSAERARRFIYRPKDWEAMEQAGDETDRSTRTSGGQQHDPHAYPSSFDYTPSSMGRVSVVSTVATATARLKRRAQPQPPAVPPEVRSNGTAAPAAEDEAAGKDGKLGEWESEGEEDSDEDDFIDDEQVGPSPPRRRSLFEQLLPAPALTAAQPAPPAATPAALQAAPDASAKEEGDDESGSVDVDAAPATHATTPARADLCARGVASVPAELAVELEAELTSPPSRSPPSAERVSAYARCTTRMYANCAVYNIILI